MLDILETLGEGGVIALVIFSVMPITVFSAFI